MLKSINLDNGKHISLYDENNQYNHLSIVADGITIKDRHLGLNLYISDVSFTFNELESIEINGVKFIKEKFGV